MCASSQSNNHGALSFSSILVGLGTCLLMFLSLDLLRRLGDHLLGLSPLELAAAAVILATLLAVIAVLAAALLKGSQRLAAAVVGPERASEIPVLAVYLCLFTVNAAFFRLRFLSEGAASFDMRMQKQIGLAALVLCAIGYLLLRRPLRRWLEDLEPIAPALLKTAAVVLAVGWALPVLVGQQVRTVPATASGNVLLITFDGLAARHMSLYGYELPTTPNLEALGRESVVFEQFHAISNMTLFCLPGFEGYYKTTEPPPGPTLSEVLASAGYRTGLIGFWSARFFGLPGIQESLVVRSWDGHPLYRLLEPLTGRTALTWASAVFSEEPDYFHPFAWHPYDDRFWKREHFPAPLSYEAALELLERRPQGNFLWIHLWPPHFPYLPTEAAGMFGGEDVTGLDFNNRAYEPEEKPMVEALERRYNEYVRDLDAQLGAFVDELRRRGVLDHSLLLVSSDHGESFSRGVMGHGGPALPEAVLRIPLLVRFPDGRGAGSRPLVLSNQLDLAPTVLAALGLEIPSQMPGHSLLPYVEEPARLSDKPRFALSSTAIRDRKGQVAVLLDRYKLIYVLEEPSIYRFYDLLDDPYERTDVSDKAPELLKRMRGMLRLR